MIRDNLSICNFIKNVWEQYDTTHLPFRCMRAVWQSIVLDPCTLQSSHTFVLVDHVTVCTTSCCERFTSSYGFFQRNRIFLVFRLGHLHLNEVKSAKLRKQKSEFRSFALSSRNLVRILACSFWLDAEIVNRDNTGTCEQRYNVYRYLWTGPALSYPFPLKVLFYAK